MSTMGTFDAFTTARLGIYAAQHGLRVTGNNVSNINTEGYTRQRLDQVSFKAGAYDMYRSQLDNHVGSGALVMNINQVRDPYLDVRFRNVSADVGYYDTMVDGLQKIADILDETGLGEDKADNEKGDGRIHAQLQDLRDKLLAFSKNPTKANNDLVRGSAETLCTLFNQYANKLDVLRKETEEDFDAHVTEANECLRNIRDLNREIRDCEIYGDNALELRDERNRQIDKLSQLMHIKVVYSEEDIGCSQKVEKLSIYLDDDNPDANIHSDESMLIDGVFGAQLYEPEKLPKLNPDFKPGSTGDVPESYKYLTDQQRTTEDGALVFNDDKGNRIDVKKNDDGSLEYLAFYDKDGTPVKATKNANNHFEYTDKTGNTVEITAEDENGVSVAITATDVEKWLADGANPVMIGTNDPEKAALEDDNKNFSLHISKLIDANGVEWVGRSSEYSTIPEDAFASYKFELTLGTWAANDTFKIGETEFTIVADDDFKEDSNQIKESDANDPAKLAEIIAKNLRRADYTVSAEPNDADPTHPTLVFTANRPGAVGGQGPAEKPDLTVINGGTQIQVGTETEVSPGKDPDASTTDPVTGTDTLYSYTKLGSRWVLATTTIKHTYEVPLDDNDLHGSIQAIRELLTEEGEFSSEADIAVDEDAAWKRGIPYYQNALDLLAREFAKQYNKLNTGTMVDQNGDPVIGETVKQTIPMLKEVDGKIYAWDEDKMEYVEQPTWELVEVGGVKYAAEKAADGTVYFTGSHGDTCFIKDKIPVDSTTAELYNILTKIPDVKTDNIPADVMTKINAGQFNDDDVKNAVQDLLKDCLHTQGHGKASIEKEVEVPVPVGGPLFSNCNDNDDPTGITAGNISVSHGWSSGKVELIPKYEILWDGDVQHSTQNTNADHMVNMVDKVLVFDPRDVVEDAASTKLFEGNFNDMFSRLNTVLGEDIRRNDIGLATSYTQQVEIDTQRDGVSGVDLNDEAMNMMQFQKAMNAAMRVMTAIDEVLDRLINNTGIAGR